MSATDSPQLVPADFLNCASCLLPDLKSSANWATFDRVQRVDPEQRDSRSANRRRSPLSPTEARVLPLVLAGLADKEIADVVGRSLPTVKHHVAAILRKNQVTSRARLMAVLREAAEGKPEPALLRHYGT